MTGLTAEIVLGARLSRRTGAFLGYVLAPTSWVGDHLDSEVWLVEVGIGGEARRATGDTATESLPR